MCDRAGPPATPQPWLSGQGVLSPRVELPGDFTRASQDVGDTCQGEEQIGQPVQIDDDQGRDLDIALEVDHAPLGAATNGARDVEHGTFAASTGNDEGFEGLELLVALVD